MSSVDIVIPCYNYARFLSQSVGSALGQEGVNVRVLIIDDCSGDDSEKVGKTLAEQDSRVEYRRHVANRGHIATYNEGLLEWASADYSVLLSADDALASGALARATQLMDRNPEVGMSCGMGRVIWDDENYTGKTETPSPEYRIVPGPNFLKRCFLMGNPVCTPTAVVRTELQHRLGGYLPELPHSGDMEMWMRFAAHGAVGIHHAVQAYYRIHSANMSKQYFSQMMGDAREVYQACERILAKWGAQFPESCQWRELMAQRLARDCCWLASEALDREDSGGYLTATQFAEQIYPEIRHSRLWRKIRTKSFVGQSLWQFILPLWEGLRELRRLLSGQSPQPASKSDRLNGWWPESDEC